MEHMAMAKDIDDTKLGNNNTQLSKSNSDAHSSPALS